MSESLFSLELHVESVARVKISCVIPAVSFRLLDYPTLIIHLVSPSSTKKLHEKTRMHNIPKEHVESELRDRYGNIPFQKGKSCLFKANISSLQHQLESTPLYVMLIDLWHKKPKLIGSTVISLSDAINKISSDVKKYGISNPSVCQDEGMFDIFNLMGTVVGQIQLSFRLMSLGGSLMPHVPTKSIMSRKGEKKTQEKDINSKENDVCSELEDVDIELNCDVKLREKNLELESGPTLQHSETQTDKPVPTACTREIIQDKKQTHIKDTEEDVIPITNTVCPPPLFYNFNSHAENVSNQRTERQGQKETHHSKKNYVVGDDDVDFIYYKPELLQPDGSTGCASVCVQTEDLKTESTVVSYQGNSDRKIDAIEKRLDSEDLPLLNALLDELTYLRTRKRGPRPSDSKADKPKKENILPYDFKKVPRTRECCLQVAAQKSLLLKNKKQNQQAVPKKVKFKQTSLTYGTTRTQLMRLEMHQQGKLKSAARFNDVGSEDKKSLSDLHTHSRQRPEIVKELVQEDLGKTHTIFTSPGAGQEGVTVSSGVQTDDGILELALTSEPKTTSDSKGEKPPAQTLENKATPKKLQKEDIQADVGNSSTRSLASQNSLDIYLPQVEGDSDGGSSFGSDDVPLPELPVTTTKYGHTGICSPDLPEPIRRQSVTSPPIRSRTSTALSMYSDDFEESLIWEAQGEPEDDNSDTASISSLSASSQVKDKKISPSVSTEEVSVDHSHPLKSDFSPKKSKKLIQKESASSVEESESNEKRTAVDVPDVKKESLFDSLNSTNSDYTLKKDGLDDGTSIQQDSDENKSILQLPRPAVDLGYTY